MGENSFSHSAWRVREMGRGGVEEQTHSFFINQIKMASEGSTIGSLYNETGMNFERAMKNSHKFPEREYSMFVWCADHKSC